MRARIQKWGNSLVLRLPEALALDVGLEKDVDLLVEVGAEPSAWFPGGLVADLEELLGRRVQVITERGLDVLPRDRVLEVAVPL